MKPKRPHPLETRIPPPFVALITGAAMWSIAQVSPGIALARPVRFVLAGLFALGAVSFAAPAMLAFRRARTTINPVAIEEASALVASGVYRRTRNPMYVGLSGLLLAWTVLLSAPAALLGPLCFVLYTTRFQILPEERVMRAKFGRAYDDYKTRVRRWL